MMTISGATDARNSIQAGRLAVNGKKDSVSEGLQSQIANAQKKLQELSSNEDMSMEEKMKERQEIQKEIASLNQQLRQRQIEKRKEEQAKGTSMDDMLGGNRKEGAIKAGGKSGSGLSQASMRAMISADSSIKQAQTQDSVVTKMEGKAGVLEAEMKQDAGRGTSIEGKAEELADIQQKAQTAASAQASSIANAKQEMEGASVTDQTEGKDEEKEMETDKVEGKGQKTVEAYTPIDIYL